MGEPPFSVMLELDGSYGEGGGQILRTAIALSAITGQPLRLYNIRKGRRSEGLAPQHLKAVQTAAHITDARVDGLKLHSTELFFHPTCIHPLNGEVDIGTAGSITLLLQCILPILLHAPKSSSFTVRGGTDVEWSPSWDYFEHITLAALGQMGASVEAGLLMRGYYPEGGGVVSMKVSPSHIHISPREFERSDAPIAGNVHSFALPSHVPERIRDAAATFLMQHGHPAHIALEHTRARSVGCGITLWSGLLGACALGRRGLPAERVGRMAASQLLKEIKSGASVDVHLADQLIPYMALSGGGEFVVREITEHTRTNVWTVQHFVDVECTIERTNELYRVCMST
nr:RNA 3'-terminal phosphate cyclase [Methermicoccus shengliensis]